MTHYTLDYSKLPANVAHEKALTDLKDYLGEEKFWTLTAEFRRLPKPLPIEQFELMVSFAGITGFPVLVWYGELWPNAAN